MTGSPSLAAFRLSRSGYDGGGELVLDIRDSVPQLELAFLEPLHLELVGTGSVLQSRDCGIKVAMLLLEARQLLLQLTLFFSIHCYQRLIARSPATAIIIRFCRFRFKSRLFSLPLTNGFRQCGDCCFAA